MAHLCILASLPSGGLSEIRAPADVQRLASRVSFASHYIAPACAAITRAMDGGSPVETDTWHPIRGFRAHSPAGVSRIVAELLALELEMWSPVHPFHGDDYLRGEFTKVLKLFQHAASVGEAVVTSLDLNRPGRAQI
jgi:hypothetical protein